MRFAIFGGTFDPLHEGHLAIARAAAAECGLDHVLFIPAGNPPHKTDLTQTAFGHRARMVELACEGEPRFRVSRMEEGTGRSYSIYTIEELKKSLAPGDEMLFLIGADAFADIRTWYRWQDVVREVEFIVVARPGREYDIPPGARVHRLDSVRMPLSSSGIRAACAAGQQPEGVPDPVRRYIHEQGLYVTA